MDTHRKRPLALTFVPALFLASLAGCASAGGVAAPAGKTVEPVTAVTPNFSWPAPARGRTTGMSLGILMPRYQVEDLSKACQLCAISGKKLTEDLLVALNNDVERALLAEGFSITGKFRDLESMTYGQKEKSNLVLVPEIVLRVVETYQKPTQVNWPSKAMSGEPSGPLVVTPSGSGAGAALLKLATGIDPTMSARYEQSGQFVVNGKIYLNMYEPITREKMWVKEINLPETTKEFTYYLWMEMTPDGKGELPAHVLTEYDQRPGALVAAINSVYTQAYAEFDRYLDPREITAVNADAKKVRAKKAY